MKKSHIHTLVTMSLLTALMLIFGFTSLGYIRLGIAEITLMCLPVIIGTLTMGLIPGLVLALLFALTSLYQLLTAPAGLFGFLYALRGLGLLLPVIFIPRLLIAVITHLLNQALAKAKPALRYGVAALCGSLTNTVFVLGMTALFFYKDLASFFSAASNATVLGGIGLITFTNGLPEAIAAMLVCVPVLLALKKAVPNMVREPRTR